MARRAGKGRLFEGGDCFKSFRQGGDYSREAINRGTAIIRGNMVYNFVRVRIINRVLPTETG